MPDEERVLWTPPVDKDKIVPRLTPLPDLPAPSHRAARAIREDPANTPIHHTKIDADQKYESIVPATRLADGYTWFVLGFAYCLVKVDRSLFEVYQAAGNITISVKSHRAEKPLFRILGSDMAMGNPWAYTIQGIPTAHAKPFIDFISSFRLTRQANDWCCNFEEINILDPFSAERHVVSTWFALPGNIDRQRRVSLANGATRLRLETPIFGMSNA